MEEVTEAFGYAETISVYKESEKFIYSSDDDEFKKILCAWNELLEGCHPMPALGVSLDYETREALKGGLWVEFGFGKITEAAGMPFEKLLVEVQEDFYGFNIIRYTSEYGYGGRCYYIDLVGKNMSEFSSVLVNLSN